MSDRTYLLYPVTPKEVITGDRKRVWWSTAVLTLSLRCCRDSFYLITCILFSWLLSFPWCEGHGWRTAWLKASVLRRHAAAVESQVTTISCQTAEGPFRVCSFGVLARTGRREKRARQFTKIWLRFSCRCDEIDTWGSCKVATPPVSSTPG